MIHYDLGDWHLKFIFSITGSVFPKACAFGVPSAIIAVLLQYGAMSRPGLAWQSISWGESSVIAGFIFVLGVLLVFRTQTAYARFWEGATLVHQLRAEWFSATSSLIAFSRMSRRPLREINDFQHKLVRLMSLMHAAAMEQVSELDPACFEIVDLDGLDQASLEYVSLWRKNALNKVDISLHWVQRCVVDSMRAGILDVPAPVLSRVFQELSRGNVHLHNVMKISRTPFPFAYAQMITVLLIIYMLIIPMFVVAVTDTLHWAGIFTFIAVFGMWGVNLIAAEIEMPFGDDANDFPTPDMQLEMNNSLLVLLDARTQSVPTLSSKAERSVRRLREKRLIAADLKKPDSCGGFEQGASKAGLGEMVDLDMSTGAPPHAGYMCDNDWFVFNQSASRRPSLCGSVGGHSQHSDNSDHDQFSPTVGEGSPVNLGRPSFERGIGRASFDVERPTFHSLDSLPSHCSWDAKEEPYSLRDHPGSPGHPENPTVARKGPALGTEDVVGDMLKELTRLRRMGDRWFSYVDVQRKLGDSNFPLDESNVLDSAKDYEGPLVSRRDSKPDINDAALQRAVDILDPEFYSRQHAATERVAGPINHSSSQSDCTRPVTERPSSNAVAPLTLPLGGHQNFKDMAPLQMPGREKSQESPTKGKQITGSAALEDRLQRRERQMDSALEADRRMNNMANTFGVAGPPFPFMEGQSVPSPRTNEAFQPPDRPLRRSAR